MRRAVAIALFAVASAALFLYSFQPGAKVPWYEALGFSTGVLGVWMTARANVWNFPVGIANSAFYVGVFFRQGYNADGGLSVLYVLLGVHGWYLWLHGGDRKAELPVTHADRRDLLQALAFLAVGLPLLLVYTTWLNGAAPFMDALLTALSLVAQVLLNRKRLENWLVWIAADAMYVPLFLYKKPPLLPTAILYALYLALAILGYLHWRKEVVSPGGAVA